ncbi:hypothetical protein PRUPE_1G384200 [Prunus persica]|uniref:Secreted protein n=1 Tax=Prunus persica TaxID=3760 RepID=A0A251RAK1_PRUPE|nr:hypothetical protein PRUPE_1G384200 [Prunus persica]
MDMAWHILCARLPACQLWWCLSSVVSVLISLISDTWANGPHDIKLISLEGEPATVACYWGSRASPKRCTTAWAWRTSPNLVEIFIWACNLQTNLN